MSDGKKFDVVIMNPPYGVGKDMQIYIGFINKVLEISNKSVNITPSNAFFSNRKKGKNDILRKNINEFKPELDILDWKEFKDVSAQSDACISVFDTKNIPEKIKIIINSHEKYFTDQNSMNFNDSSYLLEFVNKLKKYCETHKTFYSECVENPKNKQYFVNKGREKIVDDIDHNLWYVYLPYIMAGYWSAIGYEKYNEKTWNGPARIILPFKTENEAKNCFYTLATGKNRGELTTFYKLIVEAVHVLLLDAIDRYDYFPYLDFSKSYTTEELFKIIGMKYDKEEIDKILKENS